MIHTTETARYIVRHTPPWSFVLLPSAPTRKTHPTTSVRPGGSTIGGRLPSSLPSLISCLVPGRAGVILVQVYFFIMLFSYFSEGFFMHLSPFIYILEGQQYWLFPIRPLWFIALWSFVFTVLFFGFIMAQGIVRFRSWQYPRVWWHRSTVGTFLLWWLVFGYVTWFFPRYYTAVGRAAISRTYAPPAAAAVAQPLVSH